MNLREQAVLVLTVLALAGCNHREPTASWQTPPSSPSATASTPVPTPSPATPLTYPPPSDVQDFPTPPIPDPPTRAAYLTDLAAINPEIVHGQPDMAVQRGLDQCSAILQFNDYSRLVHITNERFTSPLYPDGFGLATARRILDSVHRRLCSTWPLPAPR